MRKPLFFAIYWGLTQVQLVPFWAELDYFWDELTQSLNGLSQMTLIIIVLRRWCRNGYNFSEVRIVTTYKPWSIYFFSLFIDLISPGPTTTEPLVLQNSRTNEVRFGLDLLALPWNTGFIGNERPTCYHTSSSGSPWLILLSKLHP